MSTELFRKYIDIINENQQPQMLDEGMMDILKSLVNKTLKTLGKDSIEDIATKVKQVTGGDYSLNKENAIKVAKVFGFDKMDPKQLSEAWKPSTSMSADRTGYGSAANWQGTLLQAIHATGSFATILAAANMIFGLDVSSGHAALAAIGMILLMATDAFWGRNPGQVGAMGRGGNKGWETGGGSGPTYWAKDGDIAPHGYVPPGTPGESPDTPLPFMKQRRYGPDGKLS